MATTENLPVPVAVAMPSRVGQATAIEQQRAAAEVYAAVMVAQQMPRDETRAIVKMRAGCARPQLAERAFFRYTRGEGPVTGPTIQLARELARCWGNVSYQVAELRRDDDRRESEMMAWAWDLETNTRSSTVFVVPHVRDTKKGRKPIEDVRDVYENNANMGARRLRECLFAVLPAWYAQEAQDACAATLREDGGSGKTIEQRRADAVAAFAKLNVVESQLEGKLGRPSRDWTDIDLANLLVVHRGLTRGETTREEEFPTAKVTADELSPKVEPATEAPSSTEAHPLDEVEKEEEPPATGPSADTRKAVGERLMRSTKKTATAETAVEAEDWPPTAQPPERGRP